MLIGQDDAAALEARSARCRTINDEPSLTLQGPAAEADINNIVRAYGPNFPVPPQISDPAYYADVSDMPDLATALTRIQEAKDRFYALPASLRRHFDNDPITLHEFMEDPSNWEEAADLGLLTRVPQPSPERAAQDAKPGT